MIDDAVRIRVIRAILGITSKSFASRVGVGPLTITAWERGRYAPKAEHRRELAKICAEAKIASLPSGMPVPAIDCLLFKEKENAG